MKVSGRLETSQIHALGRRRATIELSVLVLSPLSMLHCMLQAWSKVMLP